MVATAKATGSGGIVWPKGFNVENISSEFLNVYSHALTILSWQENLASEEMPKPWMWHLDWEIDIWFKKVEAERKLKYGIPDEEVEPAKEDEQNLEFLAFEKEMRGK